jgi:hypothetical protein
MTDSRDLKASKDPASAPIPYITTDLPPGRTVAALCESIWEAEARFGLLDWEVNGVKPWQARRFAIFQSLATQMDLINEDPDEPQRPWNDRMGYHARLAWGSLTQSPFRGRETYDVLAFEGPRSAKIGTERVCLYTHAITTELSRQGKRVLLLDTHLGAVHGKSTDPRRRFLDAVGIESGLRFRLSRWAAPPSDLAFLRGAEEHLTRTLAIPVELGWLLAPGIPRFLASYAPYRRLLQMRQPSEIFCVGAYSVLPPLVAAARHLGIKVTEVQHSVVSRYHLGYSYPVTPESGRAEYLPDRFLAWRGAWNRSETIPCSVEATSAPWESRSRTFASVIKQPRLMVVLSQPVIAPRLIAALLERSEALRSFEVVVKLHPAELSDPRLRQAFASLRGLENVRIATTDDLPELLSRATFQVGVYSSALYEGIDLGCRTLLVPLPGIEHVAHLLTNGMAELLDDFLASASGGDLPLRRPDELAGIPIGR